MGEDKRFVFNVGCPVVDMILDAKLKSRAQLQQELHIPGSKPIILVIQHPVTSEVENAKTQILTTLSALKEINKDNTFEPILIYSNIDAGGRKIIDEKEKSGIKLFKNLPVETFLSLLKNTSVLVGNSSCGIREAPSFKVPVVNIGTRQQGRERACNVIDVGYNEEEIIKAIQKAMFDKKFKEKMKGCKNPYGDGKSAQRIVKILETIDFPKECIQKRIAY
jgi:UDP-N-acetylglucosamine 2-epimerase (non-hydrolysing)/GDP/UDP-N,N'-diacetylbacillosamine 2-epimerase (hydrolysing)